MDPRDNGLWGYKRTHVRYALWLTLAVIMPSPAGYLYAAADAQDERWPGDTCATAWHLYGALPLQAAGTTVGYADNYDESCPYADSTAPDVVYRYTPDTDVVVDVLLCAGLTDFDTKLYLYNSCPPSAGHALACNDDACTSDSGQGFVSALWGIPLTAGTTYYIVVDGYGNEAGFYELHIRPSLPPPTCPANTLPVVAQTPDLQDWTPALSDSGASFWTGLTRYEGFSDVDRRITSLRFWGWSLYYYADDWGSESWGECAENPMEFTITFYEDANGLPGVAVRSYTRSILGTVAGYIGYPQYLLYQYDALLDPPCVLRDGWVSIRGGGATDCWFAWMTSPDGDARSLSRSGTAAFSTSHFDLALCLTGDDFPVHGACCDDRTGTCVHNVALADCAGRFLGDNPIPEPNPHAERARCADFDPPCGQATGACCHYLAGGCATTTHAACLRCPGDMDCDGLVGFSDVNPFVMALVAPARYTAEFLNCQLDQADCNGDGQADLEDINPFIARLGRTCYDTESIGVWHGTGSQCADCRGTRIEFPWDLPLVRTGSTCGSEDQRAIYELAVATPLDLNMALTEYPQYAGLRLSDHFPLDNDYLAVVVSSPYGNTPNLGCLHLPAQTYYLVVSGSGCIAEFELTITACTLPTGRCCYADPPECAVTGAAQCAELGGAWSDPLDCNTPCPEHLREDCTHPEVIAALPFACTFSNAGMSADGPAAPCDRFGPTAPMQNDAWFAWTAPDDAPMLAWVQATYDGLLTVRTNCAGPAEGCAGNAGGGEAGLLHFFAAAGTTYYFQMGVTGNFAGGGPTQFNLSQAGEWACCFGDGGCAHRDWHTCAAQGGTYMGTSHMCATTDCTSAQQPQGLTCGDAIPVPLSRDALDVMYSNHTTGRGDDYWSTCLGSFDSGEDILYSLNVTDSVAVSITLDPYGTPYTAFALARHCPPDGTCLAKVRNTSGNARTLDFVVLRPGLYTLMVDKWLAPADIAQFDLLFEAPESPTGACCLGGTWQVLELGACLDLGGRWLRDASCETSTCATQAGDTCGTPWDVRLPEELPELQGYGLHGSTCGRGNAYAGNTCLGLADGGQEIVYKLIVTGDDLTLDFVLLPDSSPPPPAQIGMAISQVCPPTDCLALADGSGRIESLTLSAGVYYLMVDSLPTRSGSTWRDCAQFRLVVSPTWPPP
jgi:hypothetical protein